MSTLYEQTVLQDSPQCLYALDHAQSSFKDLTGTFTVNAVVSGTLQPVIDGPIRGVDKPAVKGDGAGNGFFVVSSSGPVFNDPMSCEAWVYRIGSGTNWIMGKGDASNGYNIWMSGAEVRCTFREATVDTDIETSTGLVTTNAWHHVVVTYSGGTVVIYVDGEATTSGVAALTYYQAASLIFGRNGTATFIYLNGGLSYPAIYHTALSAGRVKAHYEAGIAHDFLMDSSARNRWWRYLAA